MRNNTGLNSQSVVDTKFLLGPAPVFVKKKVPGHNHNVTKNIGKWLEQKRDNLLSVNKRNKKQIRDARDDNILNWHWEGWGSRLKNGKQQVLPFYTP